MNKTKHNKNVHGVIIKRKIKKQKYEESKCKVGEDKQLIKYIVIDKASI